MSRPRTYFVRSHKHDWKEARDIKDPIYIITEFRCRKCGAKATAFGPKKVYKQQVKYLLRS